jgi:hypothetical protein
MTNSTRRTALAVALVSCTLSAVALAQSRGGGGGNAGTAAGALYGDLYVIERDGAGVPITRNVSYADAETGATVTVACVQPLAPGCGKLRLWGEMVGLFDPELYDPCAVYTEDVDLIQEVKFGRESVSRAPATVLDKSYAEALKGINSAEAGGGKCDPVHAIKLDPAGRITLCLASETDPTAFAWKTIDAPLENLGLYRAVMKDGCFANVTEETVGEEGVRVVATTALDPTGMFYLSDAGLDHLVCRPGLIPVSLTSAQDSEAACTVTPDPVGAVNPPTCPWEFTTPAPTTPGQSVTKPDMMSAAVFIAAGADKTSPVTLDEVVNVNNYVGVNLWTYTTSRKVKTLSIKYFPFTVNAGAAPGAWFKYTRGTDACKPGTLATLLVDNLDGTLSIDPVVNVFGISPPGVDLRGENGVAVTVCRNGLPATGLVCDDAEHNPVYGGNGINSCGGANWFTQAAEDARKTIWYLHNWEPPEPAY